MPQQRKILLADDVDFFLTLEKSFLQQENVEVLVANDGQEAYDLTCAHRPDLVLLDLYMPVMNGDDCCRKIKHDETLRDIPVVMVTTAGKEQEIAQCRAAGCDEIILKPIQRGMFLETIRRVLQLPLTQEKRSPVKMQVRFGRDKLFTGYSVNLSSGGLFLETATPLPPEAALSLTFCLPGQRQPITCSGSVAWVNSSDTPCNTSLPPGMGIKFTNLTLERLQEIRTFLKSYPLEQT